MKITARFPLSRTRNEPVWLPVVLSLLVIALVTFLVLAQMIPPAVLPASAPATAFSAERALEHLQTIARSPHPTGSQENARVRQYLVDQLAGLGLQAEIQTSTGVYNDEGKWGVAGPRGLEVTPETWSIAGAPVYNVVTHIPGTASTGAILLMAHYDSVPYGPGASDDGAGVAAILETARALLAGSQLDNDVILLFTDGEEVGLLGSQAFAREHTWMDDVALVLNLEARGSGGVALMYESSANNAWLIREFARAAQRPVTGSVATDVYRQLPNSSDLTLFLNAGKQGMNFAYTENWTDYHTTHDSLEDLDERSLQHHGVNALALVRHFGNLDLTTRTHEDAIFFSVLGLTIIHYPQSWAMPLLIVALVATFLVLIFGLRRGWLSVRGLAAGVAALLVSALAAAVVAYVAVRALDALKGGELRVAMGGTYNVHLYELGLLGIYVFIAGVIYATFQSRVRMADLAAGGLLYWLLLTAGSSLILPGTSYLFLWPLLAGLLALAVHFAAPQSPSLLWQLLLLLPVTLGLLLFGTAVYLVQLMFGVDIFLVSAVFVVLLLALAFPYLDFRALPHPSIWAAIPLLAGILLLVAAGLTTNYSDQQPRHNFLFYSMDADAATAAWVAETTLPDDTLAPWLGDTPGESIMEAYFPGSWQDSVWVTDAPLVSEPTPEMTVVEDRTTGNVRSLRLNLRSHREAWAVMADVTAESAILEAELYGERHSRETPWDRVFFKVIAVPAEGVDITLKLRPDVPITLRLADVSLSLPAIGDRAIQIVSPLRTGYGGGHGIDSMTLIHRRYRID